MFFPYEQYIVVHYNKNFLAKTTHVHTFTLLWGQKSVSVYTATDDRKIYIVPITER